MTNKLWLKQDEWTQYAPCDQSVDHTLPPDRDDEIRWPNEKPKAVANARRVQAICGSCPVRPECIKANCIDREENSVWVAGTWLPGTYTAASRRELDARRQELIATLPLEYEVRPDNVL